jgi:hypothetical protein
MYIFLLLLISSFSAYSAEVRSLLETTYTRDNTYCRMSKERIEIQIRSDDKMTESSEKNYGEYIFYYHKKEPFILPLNVDRLSNFRFFPGRETVCTKSLGYMLDKDKLAILFLKENRPFMDKLAIQIFNATTLVPGEALDTDYTTDKTEILPGGFMFRTYAERQGLEMGSVKIQETEYFFQDRNFSYWMKYTNAGFEIEALASFTHSPWKKHFKDEKDFLAATGWDATTKKFTNSVLYVAVNHKQKKQCLLLMPAKTKISGSETWRCL